MNPLLHAIERLSEHIGRLVSWCVLAVVFVGAANAIIRYLSKGHGIHIEANALQDLQWFGFSLIFLLGAAWTLYRNEHVRVDVVYQRMTPRLRNRVNIAGHILFLIPFCVVMIWASVPMVRDAWSIREQSPDPGGLARYPIKTAIPIGFALLLAQATASLARELQRYRRPDA